MADVETYRKRLSSQRTGVAGIDTLELTHPNWGGAVYRVCNYPGGCTTADGLSWVYVPMRATPPSSSDDLSFKVPITLQDMNEEGASNGIASAVADLVDLIPADSETPISCIVRGYQKNDDGTFSGVTWGPMDLKVVDITFNEQGCTFTAAPEEINSLPCGERITRERFPQAEQWT